MHGPVDLYIGFNRPNYTLGHPSGSKTMNDATYNYIKPLLVYLPYIKSVIPDRNGIKVDYDLDTIRDNRWNVGGFDLRKWYGLQFPELCRSEIMNNPCIEIDDKLQYLEEKIVVNLTMRYRGNINYNVLKDMDCVFVGYDNEYEDYCKRFYPIKRVTVKDALHMAKIINSCKLFIGNQSSSFAIAEQMKTKRALEVFNQSPNVIVSGPNGQEFINTEGLKTITRWLKLANQNLEG